MSITHTNREHSTTQKIDIRERSCEKPPAGNFAVEHKNI